MKASHTISLRSSWNTSKSSFSTCKSQVSSFQEDLRMHQFMTYDSIFLNYISKQQMILDYSEFPSRSQCAPAFASSPCCSSAASWWDQSCKHFYPSFFRDCRWVNVADVEAKKAQLNWVREIWWFIQTQGKRGARDLVPYFAVKQVNNIQVVNLDSSAGNWTSSSTETVTN